MCFSFVRSITLSGVASLSVTVSTTYPLSRRLLIPIQLTAGRALLFFCSGLFILTRKEAGLLLRSCAPITVKMRALQESSSWLTARSGPENTTLVMGGFGGSSEDEAEGLSEDEAEGLSGGSIGGGGG